MRCTLAKIPESNSLLQKSRLPLGILIHPFRDINVSIILLRDFFFLITKIFIYKIFLCIFRAYQLFNVRILCAVVYVVHILIPLCISSIVKCGSVIYAIGSMNVSCLFFYL